MILVTGANQANVSLQLGILYQAWLVWSVRDGSTLTYTIDGPTTNKILDLNV